MKNHFIGSQIINIVKDYNLISQESVKQKQLFETRYNSEVSNKKLNDWQTDKISAIHNRLNQVNMTLDDKLSKEARKIPSVKYPLRYSVLSSEKTLGELMRTNAFNFLNAAKNRDAILNEIDTARQTEQTDYFNSLIEIIELNRPNEIELSRLDKKEQDFYKAVETRRKDFETKNNITDSNKELEILKLFKSELEYIKQRTEKKDDVIVLIRELLSLGSEKERQEFARNNLEALNKAQGYFTNSIQKYKELLSKIV